MISVVILTKNCEKTLEKTLISVKEFNVMLIDTGSSDNTLNIAKKFSNVAIHKEKFLGFGKLRNLGAFFAKNDWILALDSDEVVSDSLKKEILEKNLEKDTVYSIPFLNFFNEKKIKTCGWHKERHIRLYNKKETKFQEKMVHEGVIKKGKVENLKNFINHYSYQSIDDFLKKMQSYTSLFAMQYQNKKKSSIIKAIFHMIFAFFKSYILKRGIFGGKEGFIISFYNANCAYYKYLKLEEYNRKCS